METFPNYDTSGLNSNSNEPEFNFEVLHDLNLADFLPISDSQQRQPTNSDRTTNFQQQSATNLSSQNSHGFSQPMTTAVSSSFSLSNNMLQTPKGSDVCSESMIISSFNMTTNSRDFQDDGLFFESLDSSALAEPSDVPFMTTVGLLSPQTSPTLSPDSSIIRRQGQKEKSSISQNCFRYSPITKQKLSSNNNNSMSQSRGRTSFINTANGNNNNSTNGQNNTTTNIMTSSPNKLAMTMELTSPLITPTSITPSLQDTIPNLNLGNNLVSSEVAMRPSTSILPSVVPITPSSLMEMKKKHSSLLKSEQNEQKSNLQQNKQNQLQPSSKVRTIFIAPSPQSQLNQIRTGGNNFGSSHIIIPSNVSSISPEMTSISTSSTSPSGTSSRKSIRSNLNASSPLALGPSIHSKSPQALKPTISPDLKPKLPGVLADEVAKQLANKSNYRNILEGTAQSLGISYSSDVHSSLESRRTTHKAAEQKRRDSLKQSFDELKKVVPYRPDSNDDEKNTKNDGKPGDESMKNISKLFLLKRTHDHIVELQQKTKEKDELIRILRDEIDELKGAKMQKIKETDDADDD